jgi:hypothetical protein
VVGRTPTQTRHVGPLQHTIEVEYLRIRAELDDTVTRRDREQRRLARSSDPIEQGVARIYNDFLVQVHEILNTGESIMLATEESGGPVVGRLAVFDEDRDLLLTPWHAPEGQRILTSPHRILVTAGPDGRPQLHPLSADAEELARDIRAKMRTSAQRESMADPLSTLTTEQAAALRAIGESHGQAVLHGPPGSGKSAIVLVELARRLLTHPQPEAFRVLFVTGSRPLAERATRLARMLGVASVTPLPQESVLRTLGVHDGATPVAGTRGAADGRCLTNALEARFAELESRLGDDAPIPHPMGSRRPDEIEAVRRIRARRASLPYHLSSKQLRQGLLDEYLTLASRAVAEELTDRAMDKLRPSTTPAQLVRDAAAWLRLSGPLRAAATAYARSLLQTPSTRRATEWDLVVVDEYQRLPAIVTALLCRQAGEVLLSGDPRQSLSPASASMAGEAVTLHELTSSLRLPAAIGSWIDRFWEENGLTPPRIRSAAGGGEVVTVSSIEQARERRPTIDQIIDAAGSDAEALSPPDALGLEWPGVVLVEPRRILDEHGEAGLFIAATRAIDRLTIVGG